MSFSGCRALHTFHVSESGQGLYFFSPSQIQRFSLLARSDLDYPRCLPDLINSNVERKIRRARVHHLFTTFSFTLRCKSVPVGTLKKSYKCFQFAVFKRPTGGKCHKRTTEKCKNDGWEKNLADS